MEKHIKENSTMFKYVKFEDLDLSSELLEGHKLKYSDLFKKLCKDDNIEIHHSADSILKNLLEVIHIELSSDLDNAYVCLNIGEYSLTISHHAIKVELSDISDNINRSLFKGRSFANCTYENIKYVLLEDNEQLYINLLKSLFLISKINNKLNIFISDKRVF